VLRSRGAGHRSRASRSVAISVSRPRRNETGAAYGRRTADQPAPSTRPDPDGTDPVGPGTGKAADDARHRVAYLPIGLVFLVLGFSGLFDESLRYAAMAFLPVGFVFLILALQGRTDAAGRPAP
jgi:hypothetical protein